MSGMDGVIAAAIAIPLDIGEDDVEDMGAPCSNATPCLRSGRTCCSDWCRNLNTSIGNCGSCGYVCPASRSLQQWCLYQHVSTGVGFPICLRKKRWVRSSAHLRHILPCPHRQMGFPAKGFFRHLRITRSPPSSLSSWPSNRLGTQPCPFPSFSPSPRSCSRIPAIRSADASRSCRFCGAVSM